MRKVVYSFTNLAPHYRGPLWAELLNNHKFDIYFCFGRNFGAQIKEIDFESKKFQAYANRFVRIKNYWLKKRVLIWQNKVISICLKEKLDVAFFLGEYTILSTWLAALICKIRGIKVVFWTHGVYGNESAIKRLFRLVFYRLAHSLMLYENRSRNILIEYGFSPSRMKVVYNSLDYKLHKELRMAISKKKSSAILKTLHFRKNIPYLIFTGRLTKVKKLDLLLQSLKDLNNKKNNVNLLIIGDGPERNALENLSFELGLENNIVFYGECYDERVLGELLYHAELCVSPGNVGLTGIHSLSFGTPVCSHDNLMNQMPEVEVIKEGETGCYFKENDLSSLVSTIDNWLISKKERLEIRNTCYQIIDEFYNPNYQSRIFEELILEN